MIIDKKIKTYYLMDFAVLADLRMKMKENKKVDKYLDFAIELKNYWT